jgi:enterochelin esterase-like enzyme
MLVYLPARPSEDYRVIIFNDGAWYLSRKGPVRATHVLDVLYSNNEIGPSIAIFVNPGKPNHAVRERITSYDDRAAQRSLEYNLRSPDYGQFVFFKGLPPKVRPTQR